MTGRILVLAGTTEATQLATTLVHAGYDVVSSLAGVTSAPVTRPGTVRTGGFGGVDGLTRFLRDERITAVVDATHPHAAVMPFHAANACRLAAVPLCRLLRDPWQPGAGDHWVGAGDIGAAARMLRPLGARRVFLTVGRQSLAPFASCAGPWFLVRSIEQVPPTLQSARLLRDRGPFSYESELQLLGDHRIDTIVTKNAGGEATAAKLAAARDLGLTVVMVERPPAPHGTTAVAAVAAAAQWVRDVTRGC